MLNAEDVWQCDKKGLVAKMRHHERHCHINVLLRCQLHAVGAFTTRGHSAHLGIRRCVWGRGGVVDVAEVAAKQVGHHVVGVLCVCDID